MAAEAGLLNSTVTFGSGAAEHQHQHPRGNTASAGARHRLCEQLQYALYTRARAQILRPGAMMAAAPLYS